MTKQIGIINLTPDSFSDGGKLTSKEQVINHCQHLIECGASVLDVGAESTRPGAISITSELEWQRLAEYIHDIAKLCHAHNVILSVDTRHAETAEKAINAGAQWINDVSGASSPVMMKLIADSKVHLVIMHSLTVPANPAITMQCDDVVKDISQWATKTLTKLSANGITADKIIFDPGVGFGKTAEQSMEIINRISEFKKLGVPILVGHSRKSFLKLMEGDNADIKTAILSKHLIKEGVDYIRVHCF